MFTNLKNPVLFLLLISLCFMVKCKLDSDKALVNPATTKTENSIKKKIETVPLASSDSEEPTSPNDSLKLQNEDSEEASQAAKVVVDDNTKLESTKKEETKVEKKQIKPISKKKFSKPKAKIEFETLTWDFGEITEGDIVKKKFKFKNTGKAPLQILGADASCGCTRPTVPFLDILPGESSEIGITYNSVNKEGDQKPEIIIESNTYPKHNILKLFGTVTPKKKVNKDSTDAAIDTLKN